MALEEIIKKISEESTLESEKIINKAESEAKKLILEAKEEAEAMKKEILKTAHKKAEGVKRSILTPARLEAKKMVLEEKNRILDEVFKGMPKEKREKNEIKVAKFIYG